jgi:cyanosortase A-associated protein
MIDRTFWRTRFLATVSIGIALTALYSLVIPTAGNRSVSSYIFPDRIFLSSWQLITSKSLNVPQDSSTSSRKEQIKSRKSYSYIKDNHKLDIEMQYIVGTRGDVYQYFYQYTDISWQIVSRKYRTQNMKYQPGVGHYILFTYGDRAYLSSCINPNGENNVTQAQFSHNLNQIPWKSRILLDWLLGKSIIRDRRCLWTQLSLPLNKLEVSTAYQILKHNWIDWSDWWKSNFPDL